MERKLSLVGRVLAGLAVAGGCVTRVDSVMFNRKIRTTSLFAGFPKNHKMYDTTVTNPYADIYIHDKDGIKKAYITDESGKIIYDLDKDFNFREQLKTKKRLKRGIGFEAPFETVGMSDGKRYSLNVVDGNDNLTVIEIEDRKNE